MDRWKDRQMDGWTDAGWMYRKTTGKTGRQTPIKHRGDIKSSKLTGKQMLVVSPAISLERTLELMGETYTSMTGAT